MLLQLLLGGRILGQQLLNGDCPMKLVVEGRVVRSDGQSTAIRMERHEFRFARILEWIRKHCKPLG